MPIRASYTAICDQCGNDSGSSRPTEHDAVAYAVAGGWSPYPLLCSDCRLAFQEKASHADEQARQDNAPAEGDGVVRVLEEGPRRPRRGW